MGPHPQERKEEPERDKEAAMGWGGMGSGKKEKGDMQGGWLLEKGGVAGRGREKPRGWPREEEERMAETGRALGILALSFPVTYF